MDTVISLWWLYEKGQVIYLKYIYFLFVNYTSVKQEKSIHGSKGSEINMKPSTEGSYDNLYIYKDSSCSGPKYIKYFNEFILLYLTNTLIFPYWTIKESSLFWKQRELKKN